MDEKTRVKLDSEDYKALEAEFFDKDLIIEPEYTNYRIDKSGQRFYVRIYDDKKYIKAPSYSEIMNRVLGVDYYLADWMATVGKDQATFERINSANYGTFFHIQCADILRGKAVNLDEQYFFEEMQVFCEENNHDFEELLKWYKQKGRKILDDVIGFICWIKEYNVRPIAMEYPLMHPEGLWAGTTDLVCKLAYDKNEIIAMVDIKSTLQGFFESNEIQLHAYKTLWDMEHPEIQIERVFNYCCNSFRRSTLAKYLSGGKSGRFKPFQFKDQTGSENTYKWQHYVELYHGQPKNLEFAKRYEYDAFEKIDLDTDLSKLIIEYDLFNKLENKLSEEVNE